MSWVNDLASVFGLPAGAGLIATAMYAACVAAEKTARPEALTEIGRILKDPAWGARSVRSSAIIERVFNWTFGERHLSLKCITRSVCATTILGAAITIFLYLERSSFHFSWGDREYIFSIGTVMVGIIAGFVSNYLVLWQTRIFIRFIVVHKWFVALLWPIYLILSLIIFAFIFMTLTRIAGTLVMKLIGVAPEDYSDTILMLSIPFASSTLLTSLWVILTFLSITILKLLLPIHRFTTWFFDVEKYPVQAIGMVSGTLVMVVSFAWSLMRIVI
jgi:hypothetical protein